jgi:hypothetical protein
MAIKIPIITIFDNKGLRAAQYQLNKVSGSFSALGRNFAIAGTAIGVFATGLGVAVKAASNFEAEYEGVNQVFGAAAKSVQAFAEAASKTAGLSETAALQGAKTFGLFAKSAGLGEQEAAKFSTSLVQLAGDLGSFNDVPTEEALAAIQSGLMGQAEPLRKFGVFLTDTKLRAEAQAMAIYDGTGALTDQQKMLASYSLIMKDTKIQQGDFVKYQDTFGNSFKTVQTDIQNITKDIGMELLPVIAEITPIIGDLATELGGKLATAVKAVDWSALLGSLVDFLAFIVNNIETIARLAGVIFVLNTAFNTLRAAQGIYNAVATLTNILLKTTETTAKTTTGAVSGLRTALLLGGVVIAVGSVIDEYRRLKGVVENSNTQVKEFDKQVIAVTGAAAKLSPINTIWQKITYAIMGAVAAQKEFAKLPTTVDPRAGSNYAQGFRDRLARQAADVALNPDLMPDLTQNGGAQEKTYAQTLNAAVKNQKLFTKLTTKSGISEGLAADLLGGTKGLATAKKIAKGNTDLATKVQKKFNKTAAGIAEIQAKADKAQAQIDADQAKADAERDAGIAREQAATNERERIYESFANSVKSTFSQIRDSILSAFDLPSLGSSTDSIIRNMGKLLTKTREFSSNITQLSSMGLDPKLLQQIISQGPIAGARLAASLVAGGASGLAAINTGYSELSGVASTIGMTGTNAAFGTSRVQSVYNIEVNGGVGSGATIGQAIVDAIKAYERTSGAVWQGA